MSGLSYFYVLTDGVQRTVLHTLYRVMVENANAVFRSTDGIVTEGATRPRRSDAWTTATELVSSILLLVVSRGGP